MTALAALALLTTAVQDPSLESDFDVALGLAGLSRSTATFDDGILQFYRHGESPTTLFGACYRDPWRTPYFLGMARRQTALAAGRPAALIEEASRELGWGSRRSLLSDPAQPYIEQVKAPGALDRALQKMKDAGLVRGTVPSTAQVPAEVQQAAAAVVFAALGLVDYRRAATASVPDLGKAYALAASGYLEPDGPVNEAKQRALQSQVDLSVLFAASQDMAAVVSWASATVRSVATTKAYSFVLDTDWGRIDLSGGSDSVHEGLATFVLIDTGGNDTYLNVPSNATPGNWVSVVLDSSGDDKYLSDPALAKTPVAEWGQRAKQRGQQGPGSALFGMTFLIDSAGDDVYRSARSSFGSATFGVAYVGDLAGNDVYDAYGESEGYGHSGIGILNDSEGKDTYACFTQSQGVGLPVGYGLLLDAKGDDTYVANDAVLDFPSAQSADHNNSMAQGAGYGFRADYLTGHSLSGGIGVLYDMAGDDKYTCGVFGQGTGYWEGTGLLWDDGGKDAYVGQWYVQGAAAHFAIGYLEDKAGDDDYHAFMNMAQGAGHDFSEGWLIDRDGNDHYQGPNLSLGAGNANGMGVFVDVAGNDTYVSSGISLGSSAEAQKASLRERALCLGVFMDLGGTDTYPDFAGWAKNGNRQANWNYRAATPQESQVGVFLDR